MHRSTVDVVVEVLVDVLVDVEVVVAVVVEVVVEVVVSGHQSHAMGQSSRSASRKGVDSPLVQNDVMSGQ